MQPIGDSPSTGDHPQSKTVRERELEERLRRQDDEIEALKADMQSREQVFRAENREYREETRSVFDANQNLQSRVQLIELEKKELDGRVKEELGEIEEIIRNRDTQREAAFAQSQRDIIESQRREKTRSYSS